MLNNLRKKVKFDMVVLTKDWHPANHMSFYSNNKDLPNAKLYAEVTLPNGNKQVCISLLSHACDRCTLHEHEKECAGALFVFDLPVKDKRARKSKEQRKEIMKHERKKRETNRERKGETRERDREWVRLSVSE